MATNPEATSPPLGKSDTGFFDLEFVRLGSLFLTLVLCLLLIRQFELESAIFQTVMLVAVVGFAVSAVIPERLRLYLFVGLSFLALGLSFGVADTLLLLLTGSALIGICHLPIALWARLAVLGGISLMLGAARVGYLPSPISPAVWPILASMFMFRLALYLHAVKHNRVKPGLAWTVSYFFMLPNVIFPLFPVVDYNTFTRRYFDKPAVSIYREGVVWIVRGLTQLVLYRFVYLFVVNDTADIFDLGDLSQFLLGTYLLYLRVSGQFHLIVGLLLLFGFRLPETHHLYYLASSFTDFWRRINIYWKDFMMKLVFYPVHFRLRRKGPSVALIVATLAVFVVTWLLHSYQWFWLRGDLFFSIPDALFWGILSIFVVINSLIEIRSRKKPADKRRWHWQRGFKTLGTFWVICVLWSLWSSESVVGWLWLWPAAANASLGDATLLLVASIILFAAGGFAWAPARPPADPADEPHWPPLVRSAATVIALLALAQPAIINRLPATAGQFVTTLTSSQLNVRDEVLQNRGYYENLDMQNQLSSQLLDRQQQRGAEWKGNEILNESGIIRRRTDFIHHDFAPSMSVDWNGATFSTNRWGMRDREYPIEKPENAVRIALMGMSVVMGAFVNDGDAFESVLERRLNESESFGPGISVEVLNFAVSGYELPRQMALMEQRALNFDPDVVILVGTDLDRYHTEDFIHKTLFDRYSIPYDEFRNVIAGAGLDDIDLEGIPVTFARLRDLAERFGIDTRMPWNEGWARVRGLGDPINEWVIARSDRLIRESGALPALLVLNAVRRPARQEPRLISSARASGWAIFDLRDVYEGYDHAELAVAPWDSHPNSMGHRIIGERLYQEIRDSSLLTDLRQ